ncbi:MAG: hypothetical protein JSV80_12260 [Acidobacteriota bacterium]|nr:MAG: hypothetical protein JSV80_12260 [Acidobacteriota bacterium]
MRSCCVLLAVSLLVWTVLAVGCKTKDPVIPITVLPPVTDFLASTTAPTANLVFLRGEPLDDETVIIEVMIQGQTTSSDIYSFSFDLVLSNPLLAELVTGSELLGSALVPSGGQGTSVQVAQNGDRIVVGVTKTNGGSGNGVGAGAETIVTFEMRALRGGETELRFAGAPPGPSDPLAEDSKGDLIGSIVFDPLPAKIVSLGT